MPALTPKIRRGCKVFGEAVWSPVDAWAKPLVARLRQFQGTMAATMAQLADRTFDRAREFRGRMDAPLREYLHKVSGMSPLTRLGEKLSTAPRVARQQLEATRALGELVPSGTGGYSTRMERVVEGKEEPNGPHETAIRDGYRGLVFETGRIMEEVGTKIRVVDKDGTPKWIRFTADANRHRFLRIPTADLHAILESPDSPAAAALVRDLAAGNGLTEIAVRKALFPDGAPAGLTTSSHRGSLSRDNAETARSPEFKYFPSYIDTPGGRLNILEARSFEAGDALVRHSTKRAAFIDVWGQDIPVSEGGAGIATGTKIAELEREVSAAGGQGRDAVRTAQNLIRAMNGVPLESATLKWVPPGSAGYQFIRVMNTLLTVRTAGLLSGSWIPNLFEPLSKAPAFIGMGNLMRAYRDVIEAAARGQEGWTDLRTMWSELAQKGAITTDVANWLGNSDHFLQDTARWAHQMNVLPRWTNELNDFLIARAAHHFVEHLRTGAGSEFDRMRLERMGLEASDINSLMSGMFSQAQAEHVLRQAPAVTQFSLQQAGERSALANSRAYTAIFRFQQYAMGTVTRLQEASSGMLGAIRDHAVTAHKGTATKASRDKAWAATGFLAQFLMGSLSAGSLSLMLRYGWLVGGPGAAIYYALFGGQADAMLRTAGEALDGDSDWYGPLLESAMPVSSLTEVFAALGGHGPYRRGASTLDTVSTMIDRNVPLVPWVATTLGLAEDNKALDKARKKLNLFQRSVGIEGGGTESDDAWEAARKHVRVAAKAIGNGADLNDEDVIDNLRAAFGVRRELGQTRQEAVDSLMASVRGMKIQPYRRLTDAQVIQLQEALDPQNLREIEAFNKTLEALAKSLPRWMK